MPDIYFNSRKLPKNWKKEYVAFLDVMGVQNRMKISLNDAANFIFKLHAAVIAALKERSYKGVFYYPLMDGIYITSRRKDSMVKILVRIFRDLAKNLLNEEDMEHVFLVRAAVAYGPVVHGHDIPLDASKVFEMEIGYKEKILLGAPMIKAYEGEKSAAPMGIYVDQSAWGAEIHDGGRFAPDWKWWNATSNNNLKLPKDIEVLVRKKLDQYFAWINEEGNEYSEGYKIDRRIEHAKAAGAYFE